MKPCLLCGSNLPPAIQCTLGPSSMSAVKVSTWSMFSFKNSNALSKFRRLYQVLTMLSFKSKEANPSPVSSIRHYWVPLGKWYKNVNLKPYSNDNRVNKMNVHVSCCTYISKETIPTPTHLCTFNLGFYSFQNFSFDMVPWLIIWC